MARATFARKDRLDNRFFLAFVMFGWAAIVLGFSDVVWKRYHGQADSPASMLLQLHVFVFVGWMALLTAQIMLVKADRRDLHRVLGWAAAVLIPAMIVTGLGTEVQSQRLFSTRFPEDLKFFVTPLAEMLIFFVLATSALILRRDAATHKRLILMATSFVLVAAFNRWWGAQLEDWFGPGFWGVFVRIYLGPNALIACGVLYDLATGGRVHRSYAIAIPAILVVELLSSAIWHNPTWPPIARWILGIGGN